MLLTVAYFLADSAIILEEFQTGRGGELLLHHCLTVPGCLASLYLGGHVFSLNFLNMFVEVPTLFVNLRSIMIMFNWQDSIIYKANQIALLTGYFWFRILLCTYIFFTKIFFSVPGFSHYDYQNTEDSLELNLIDVN